MTSPLLAQLLDDADFYSLSVVRSGDEWQANLQETRGNSFRVCHGATASEAIAALFAPTPVFEETTAPQPLPPCPIPPPPF